MVLALAVLTFALWGSAEAISLAGDTPLAVWAIDPHIKVFRDTPSPETLTEADTVIRLRAARNEYECAQIVLRPEIDLGGVTLEWSPLVHQSGDFVIPEDSLLWNFVGYIPLEKNTPASEAIIIRKAPCEVPDPLLEIRTLDLPANQSQPVWLTIFVPREAPAGEYRGSITVLATPKATETTAEGSVAANPLPDEFGGTTTVRTTLQVQLVVDHFILPDGRHLWVTNWFNLENIARAHQVEIWSEGFWEILARYAANMAAHRQNVVLTPWSLVAVSREEDGTFSFDFSRFDRYVELFERAGVADRIEISHIGGGEKGWGTPIVLYKVRAYDKAKNQWITWDGEIGLPPLLKALEQHLEQRGWLAKSMIHVADEPILSNLDSWRRVSDFVAQAAPRLRRIEAIETIDLCGALEVWVPQLSHFERWREAYEARRSCGEFWYYICVNPHGNLYPNRFLDYPLSRVRVLHWVNFAEDLVGYLHWGWNFWGKDPFGVPTDRLPPGDTHVIYPGSQGPLNSIRWEIQRESLEDFEYLHLLCQETNELKARLGPSAAWLDPRRRACELCRQVVPSIIATELDPRRIMEIRQRVAEEIVALEQPPLLLVQTEPAEGKPLAYGPIVVEVFGITEPGTQLRVNGRNVEIRSDGTFTARAWPQGSPPVVKIEAEKDGHKKLTIREFQILR